MAAFGTKRTFIQLTRYPRPLPAICQLPQPQEHGLRVRMPGQIGKRLSETADHARTPEPEEGVDLLFKNERGDERPTRVLVLDLGQKLGRMHRRSDDSRQGLMWMGIDLVFPNMEF